MPESNLELAPAIANSILNMIAIAVRKFDMFYTEHVITSIKTTVMGVTITIMNRLILPLSHALNQIT